MINKLREQMSNVKLLVLNIVIIVLAIILLIILWLTAQEVYYSFAPYEYKEDSFVYSMENEDYGRIVSMYRENCQNGYGDRANLQECYGVAKYYEAAFDYRVYMNAEEIEAAEAQRSAMDEAELQMGTFAFMADKIDEKLGITE